MKNPLRILAIISAMFNEKISKMNQGVQGLSQRGYYHRYMGKSKTFKKNKRKGL